MNSHHRRLGHHHRHDGTRPTYTHPVCGMAISPQAATAERDIDGRAYYFCPPCCAATFDADLDHCADAEEGRR